MMCIRREYQMACFNLCKHYNIQGSHDWKTHAVRDSCSLYYEGSAYIFDYLEV
jgi:hypothetical protein